MNERCSHCPHTVDAINGKWCVRERLYVERLSYSPCQDESYE